MPTPTLGVIPARYASTRFPGKPLIDIEGKSMIQRVYEQAQKASCLNKIIVATDDDRIFQHVIDFGGEAEMTSDQIATGTERVAVVAEKYPEYDFCINIQGDLPYIDPQHIDLLGAALEEQQGKSIATLVIPVTNPEILKDPKFAKVVLTKDFHAMYFSRYAVPYHRDIEQIADWPATGLYYKHIGIYGFPREILLQLPSLSPVDAELAESLEQLRWMGHGFPIKVAVTHTESLPVDTPQDLEKLKQFKENNPG